MTVPLVDQIRTALRHADAAMTSVQLQNYLPLGTSVEVVHTLCTERKRAGEFVTEILDGKVAYRLAAHPPKREETAADAAPAADTSEGSHPEVEAAAKPEVQKRRKALLQDATPSPQAASAPEPEASPEVALLAFIRAASALVDETLEKAIHLSVNPAVLAQFARASKAMHGGALMLIGTP